MKKSLTKIAALSLALSLAVPMVSVAEGEAAAKKPTMSTNTVTIYTGKTKTISIKNVKKKDVKSLSVKAYNKSSTKVVKKNITSKKVSFTLKAVGPHASVVDVVLKLKKKIAGKKAYKFSFLTCTGSPDKPDVVLEDGITKSANGASIFKEGEDPKDVDNWGNQINLLYFNKNQISMRNTAISYYFEDGTEAGADMWYRDYFHPESLKVNDTEKGYDEAKIYAKVTNAVSNKTVTTDVKTYRVISQAYIDKATAGLKTFASKYASSAEGATIDSSKAAQVEEDFLAYLNPYAIMMGMSDDVIVGIAEMFMGASASDLEKVKKSLTDYLTEYRADCKKIAAYLKTPEADADLFCDLFKMYIEASLSDPANLTFKQPGTVGAVEPPTNALPGTINVESRAPAVVRFHIVNQNNPKEDFYSDSLCINQSQEFDTIKVQKGHIYRVKAEMWFFGWKEILDTKIHNSKAQFYDMDFSKAPKYNITLKYNGISGPMVLTGKAENPYES